MYRLTITVVKGEYTITARFETECCGINEALVKASRYADILMDEEKAEYVEGINIWKMAD